MHGGVTRTQQLSGFLQDLLRWDLFQTLVVTVTRGIAMIVSRQAR